MELKLTDKEIKDYNDEIKSYIIMHDFEEEISGPKSYSIDEYMVRFGIEYLLDQARDNEPSISDDLKSCMADGCHFEGFDYRIKSVSRLREKLLGDTMKKFGGDYVKATYQIYDTLRYTVILPFENHFEYLDNFLNDLLDMDYTLVRVKNRWKEDYCKGVTVVLKTADGIPFEIQFHTQENYDVKEIYSREPYQVYRDPNAPAELRSKANRLRVYYHSKVRLPEGALSYEFKRNSMVK